MTRFFAGLAAVVVGICIGLTAVEVFASRNSGGTMSQVNGPYTAGTTIISSQINTRLADIETEITDSLSRSGKGGMLVSLSLSNGVAGTPALNFTSETNSGWYRAGTNDLRCSVAGSDILKLLTSGITVTGSITATATATNTAGASLTGVGSGPGVGATGGASSGDGVAGVGGAGSGSVGVRGTGGGTNGAGVVGLGTGSGNGGTFTGGASGPGAAVVAGGGGSPTAGALMLTPQAAPSAPSDGNVWVETSSNVMKARINGATKTVGMVGDALTKGQFPAVGQQIASSSGNFQTQSSSPVQITNQSVTLTTIGRPVLIMLQTATTSGTGTFKCGSGTTSTCGIHLTLKRDGSAIARSFYLNDGEASRDFASQGAWMYVDVPSAASHTYTLFMDVVNTLDTALVTDMQTVAFEL